MQILNKREDQLAKGLTYDLWKNFPVTEALILRDLNAGFGVYPNLVSFNVEQGNNDILGPDGLAIRKDTENTVLQLTKATGGQGGGIRLTQHATDNHETYLQWCGMGGSPFTISTTANQDRELIFEVAFRTNTITNDRMGFFIGLAEEGLAVADTMNDTGGVMADKDFIGIQRQEGDGENLDILYRKEGQDQQTFKADWKTIAVNTWYHYGMRWNPINKTIAFWFGTGDRSTTPMRRDGDNVMTATQVAAATFPNGEGLAPFIGVKQAHTTESTLDIRLLACAQAAVPAG